MGDATRRATGAAVRLATCTRILQEPGPVHAHGLTLCKPFSARSGAGQTGRPCAWGRAGYRPAAMPEPGLVTLVKIVGTLLGAMSVVPFLFLFAPGDRKEPAETFDGDVQ